MKQKIGIVGAGKIVENQHLPVLKNIKELEIAWLYDLNQERLSLLSNMFNVATIEDNIEHEIKEIDICLIATPVGSREKYIKLCAENNIAVYCEKPFAITWQEHQTYCDLFLDHAIGVGFQRRYYANVILLKEILENKIFGTLKKVSIKQGGYNLKSGGYNSFFINSKLSGGGVLIESAIHVIDQFLYALDVQNFQIQGVNSFFDKGIDYDTNIVLEVEIEQSTIPVNIEISTIQPLVNGIEIIFEQARLYCAMQPLNYLTIKTNKDELYKIESLKKGATSVNQAFFLFWKDFILAQRQQKANPTSAKHSLITTKVISEIYKNIREKTKKYKTLL